MMAIPTTTENLHPLQVRAGRAIADVTMQSLAGVAGVSAETILRIESGATIPSRATAARVIDALARFGVEITPEGDGHGAGARMREPDGNALVVRRDALRNGEIGTVVRVDGKPVTARVDPAALALGGSMEQALSAFDLQRPQIARAIARKLEAGAVDDDGHIRLGPADFDSAETSLEA